MYVDYDYYTTTYLLGRDPVISEAEFLYWEGQAELEIDKRTYQRLKQKPDLIDDSVKKCTCAVAELLYQSDQISAQAYLAGNIGPLTSYSNDGESGSFDLSQSVYTEDGKKKKIRELIYNYLSHTGLLYAGLDYGYGCGGGCHESQL